MVELLFRVLLALGAAALPYLGISGLGSASMPVAGVVVTIAIFGFLLERRGLVGPMLGLCLAIFDTAALSFVLARVGWIDDLGFLALVPLALSASRVPAPSLAIVGGCTVFAVGNAFARTIDLGMLINHSVATMIIAWLIGRNTRVVTVELTADTEEPVAPVAPHGPSALDESLARSYLELREAYRKLRDHAQGIERRSKRDKVLTNLYEASTGIGERVQQRVTRKLRDLTGVAGISLHTTAEYADTLVVRASSGDLPERMLTSSIPIPGVNGETQLKRQFDQWMRALRSEDQSTNSRSVVLKAKGRVVGILCLTDPSGDRLQRAGELLEEIAPSIGQLLHDDLDHELLRKRLKEAELLYTVATIAQGAESSLAVAARVVRELWGNFDLDHLAIQFVDISGTMTAASEGATAALFPHLQLGGEMGLDGWLSLGAPELVINDTTDDDRVDKRVAIQKRVGSYAVFPIRFGEEPFGFVTAATHRVGGIDVAEAETLRILTAELSQAIGRLESDQSVSGLVTPGEFQSAIAKGHAGAMIYLEPLRREEIVADYGEPAYEHAVRTFARRLRGKLPSGALLCRRREGDYVAFLRDVSEPFAASWANEASAMAAMIGVTTPDGRAKIPLALRAKVSMISPQQDQNLVSETAGVTNP